MLQENLTEIDTTPCTKLQQESEVVDQAQEEDELDRTQVDSRENAHRENVPVDDSDNSSVESRDLIVAAPITSTLGDNLEAFLHADKRTFVNDVSVNAGKLSGETDADSDALTEDGRSDDVIPL